MYIREHKGKWRFAECYPDPLTGRKREVSIVLDKNTPQTRKEASIALQEKIREDLHDLPGIHAAVGTGR